MRSIKGKKIIVFDTVKYYSSKYEEINKNFENK